MAIAESVASLASKEDEPQFLSPADPQEIATAIHEYHGWCNGPFASTEVECLVAITSFVSTSVTGFLRRPPIRAEQTRL